MKFDSYVKVKNNYDLSFNILDKRGSCVIAFVEEMTVMVIDRWA